MYIYKVRPGESGYLYVDLGFSITRQIKSRKRIAKGSIIQSSRSAKGFKVQSLNASPKDLYTYRAYLERVIDGDTLKLHIDLGFDTFIAETVRLRGIDAPERKTEKGQAAKRFVTRQIKQANEIIVRTHWEDKFGRYLVDVWVDDEYLNQYLLDEDLAGRY